MTVSAGATITLADTTKATPINPGGSISLHAGPEDTYAIFFRYNSSHAAYDRYYTYADVTCQTVTSDAQLTGATVTTQNPGGGDWYAYIKSGTTIQQVNIGSNTEGNSYVVPANWGLISVTGHSTTPSA